MKTSFIFSLADKVLSTTSSNSSFSTNYDDSFSINGQVIIPDPEVTWVVPTSLNLSTTNQEELARNVWSVINGENYHGITRYFLSNRGLFYNNDMKNKGIFPVNFKLIGGNTEWKVTKLTSQPFNVGMYTQSPSTNQYELNNPFYTQYRDFDQILSEIEWPEDDDIINKINSYTTSQSSYNLFYSKVYEFDTGKQRNLISLTPLMFSVEKNSFTVDVKYSMTPIDVSNRKTIIPFYVIPTSKVWIFDESWVVQTSSNTGQLNINDYGTKAFSGRRANYIPLSGFGYDKNEFIPSTGLNSWRYQEVDLFGKVTIFPFILSVSRSELHSNYQSALPDGNDRNGTWVKLNQFSSLNREVSYLKSLSSWRDKSEDDMWYTITWTNGSFPPSPYGLNPFVKSAVNLKGEWRSQIPVDYNAPLLRYSSVSDFGDGSYITRFTWNDLTVNVQLVTQQTVVFKSQIIGTYDQKISLPYISSNRSYHKYSIDRLYEQDDKPLFKSIPVTSSHYSEVRSINDDIILSNEIDDISGLSKITDDHFFSNIISDSSQKKQEYSDYLNTQSNLNIKDEVNKAIDRDSDMASTDKYLVKDVIENQYASISDGKLELNSNQVPDYDMYQSYKRIFMSFMQDETKIGIMGHNRILNTNPNQSPVYSSLIDIGLDDDKIKQFSNNLKDEFDSITGSDSYAIIDSIDMVNEISIINSLVSSQVNEISNAIDKVSKAINNKKDTSEDQNLMNMMSEIFSAAGSLSQSISDNSNQYISLASKTISDNPGSYDSLMLERAVNNSTGYVTSFINALVDDPYLALKQHSAYLRSRAEKVSVKASIIDKILSGMNTIVKIPSMFISAMTGFSKLIGTLAKVAVSGAVQAITIIDNIDKLVFISEQFLSKGVEKYATIPTVYDDMFTPPDGFDKQYKNIKRKARLEINKDLSTTSIIKQLLLETKTNPIEIEGTSYSYNDYNVDSIVGTSNGFYYPNKRDMNLPIVKSESSTLTAVLPDLTDFIPMYPQRGSLWLTFIKQLNEGADLGLSPFIPLTPEVLNFYSGMIAVTAIAAGAAAGVAAGIRGDWIGIITGVVLAASAVTAANTSELINIVGKRHMISENKDVYTHFSNNYNNYVNKWNTLLSPEFLKNNYTFIISDSDIPLFSDASDFKKFFIQIKEIMFLIGNITMLITASVMIGKTTKKLSKWYYDRRTKKALKTKHKFENQAYKDKEGEAIADIDSKISDVNNDQSLSQSEKDKLISKLNSDKKNIQEYYAAMVTLNPTNKGRLNGILASNWGVGVDATSPVSGQILGMSSIGPATQQALNGFKSQVEKFVGGNKELGESLNDINQGTLSPSDIITSATSNLLSLLIKVKDDTDTLKKFV